MGAAPRTPNFYSRSIIRQWRRLRRRRPRQMSYTSDSITAAKSQMNALITAMPWSSMNLMSMGTFKAVVLRKHQSNNQKGQRRRGPLSINMKPSFFSPSSPTRSTKIALPTSPFRHPSSSKLRLRPTATKPRSWISQQRAKVPQIYHLPSCSKTLQQTVVTTPEKEARAEEPRVVERPPGTALGDGMGR